MKHPITKSAVGVLLVILAIGVCVLAVASIQRRHTEEKARTAARSMWIFLETWNNPHATRPYPFLFPSATGTRDVVEWLADEDMKGFPSNAPPYKTSSTSYLNWLSGHNMLDWAGGNMDQGAWRNLLLLRSQNTPNATFTPENNPWCVVAVPYACSYDVPSDMPVIFTRNINLRTRHLRGQDRSRIGVDRASRFPAVLLTRGGTIRVIDKDSGLRANDFHLPTNIQSSVQVWGGDGIRW